MAKFGFATLNHSPLHGLPSQWQAHLDATKAAGFDALAPDVFWLRALEADGISIASLADELSSRGLACMELAGIAIGSVEATRAELEEIARYAEVLDAEFVNARIVEPVDAALVDSLRRAAEVFSGVGTRIALEFSSGTQLKGVADGQALAEAAKVEGLGVTLDTWHFFLAAAGPDWAALDALPGEWLANVQLSDGVPYAEGEFGKATMHARRLPGEGDFDLARFADVLRAKGFDGAVVVEVLSAPWRERGIDEFAEAAAAHTRAWWEGPART